MNLLTTKLSTNLFLLFCFLNVALLGQPITPEEIIKNVKSMSMEVDDYIVDAEANINLEMIRIPRAKIKIYFKQPDKFYYDSKNFALLPRAGFNFNLSNFIDDNADIKILKEETINNTNVYMLELTPKNIDNDEINIKSYLWIDKKNWVIKRMVTESDAFKMIVDCNHSYVSDKYYLPSLIKYSVEPVINPDDEAIGNPANQQPPNRARRRGGFMSKGEITLSFKNYIINSNFSDDIFKKQDKEQDEKQH
jgi:outer membrane lipoprotein-sorting protein